MTELSYEDMIRPSQRGAKAKKHAGLREKIVNAKVGQPIDITEPYSDDDLNRHLYKRDRAARTIAHRLYGSGTYVIRKNNDRNRIFFCKLKPEDYSKPNVEFERLGERTKQDYLTDNTYTQIGRYA
jgi:hypothetical protein